jgi:hypothetical protein
MVTGESDAATQRTDEGTWSVELDRLGKVLEEMLEEFGRLAAENRRLRQGLEQASGRHPGDPEMKRRLKELEKERRDWQKQRQAIADRIEVILGKFQWLEAARGSQSATLTDA